MAKPKNSGPIVEDASSRSFRTAKVKQDVPSDAAVPEANSKNIGATEVPLKFTPWWSDWNERHTISLFNAVCLLHNIRPSKPVLAKLREQKESRTFKFQNHLNTLLDRQPIEPLLKNASSNVSAPPNEKTKIVLKDFIEWAKSKRPFPELTVPSAFWDIKPYDPSEFGAKNASPTDAKGSGGLNNGGVKSTEAPDDDGQNLNSKQIGTISRILLAMAIKHYGFRPFDAPMMANQEMARSSVYAPIKDLCESLGLSRPKRADGVAAALRAAAAKVGASEAKGAYEKWTELLSGTNKKMPQ